jgi:hypothetical protein
MRPAKVQRRGVHGPGAAAVDAAAAVVTPAGCRTTGRLEVEMIDLISPESEKEAGGGAAGGGMMEEEEEVQRWQQLLGDEQQLLEDVGDGGENNGGVHNEGSGDEWGDVQYAGRGDGIVHGLGLDGHQYNIQEQQQQQEEGEEEEDDKGMEGEEETEEGTEGGEGEEETEVTDDIDEGDEDAQEEECALSGRNGAAQHGEGGGCAILGSMHGLEDDGPGDWAALGENADGRQEVLHTMGNGLGPGDGEDGKRGAAGQGSQQQQDGKQGVGPLRGLEEAGATRGVGALQPAAGFIAKSSSAAAAAGGEVGGGVIINRKAAATAAESVAAASGGFGLPGEQVKGGGCLGLGFGRAASAGMTFGKEPAPRYGALTGGGQSQLGLSQQAAAGSGGGAKRLLSVSQLRKRIQQQQSQSLRSP